MFNRNIFVLHLFSFFFGISENSVNFMGKIYGIGLSAASCNFRELFDSFVRFFDEYKESAGIKSSSM